MPNQIAHLKRRQRIRASIRKSANGRCRLHVHRSAQHIYAQIIDDTNGKTLASASTLDKELKGKLEKSATRDAAKTVGELIAQRARAANVSEVVFDRGGFLFHGRVKALAEAARAAGLKF